MTDQVDKRTVQMSEVTGMRKRLSGQIRAMLLVVLMVAVAATIFTVPQKALAHFGNSKGDAACTTCHNDVSPITGATINVAINGTATTSVTANEGDLLEIDYYDTGVAGKGTSNIQINLPSTAWAIMHGTAGTEPAGWSGTWNPVWDESHGNNKSWMNFNDSKNIFTIENTWSSSLDGSNWDGGNGLICDDGTVAPECNNDLDTVDSSKGTDFRILVPKGVGPGPHTVTVYGIGHTPGGTQGNIPATLSITVNASADNTPPTDGTALALQSLGGAIELRWGAATDASGISVYKVVRVVSDTAPPTSCSDANAQVVYVGPETHFVHRYEWGNGLSSLGVQNADDFYYRVCAYDTAGNESTGTTALQADGSDENTGVAYLQVTEAAAEASDASVAVGTTNQHVDSFNLAEVNSNGNVTITAVEVLLNDFNNVSTVYVKDSAGVTTYGSAVPSGNTVIISLTANIIVNSNTNADYRIYLDVAGAATGTVTARLKDLTTTSAYNADGDTGSATLTISGGGPVLPTLTTPTATAIGSTIATLGANITLDGGEAPGAHGVVWGTSTGPTRPTGEQNDGATTTGVFTQARTGLNAGTQIFYRGFANNSAGDAYSSEGSFYTEPATQASAAAFNTVNANDMNVTWTRGSGSEVIVLMRSGAAVATDPTDGTYTGYTANAAFGSGTAVGSSFVIYKGTGTTVPVTGLSPSTTYHVAVYELAGAADTSGDAQGTNYLQTSPAINSQATIAGASPPTLTTPTVSAITNTTATLGATVTADGGAVLTARGTVWGTATAPTGNLLAEGATAVNAYTHGRTGLNQSTRIFYRGYATNSAGTAYSPEGSFYTEPTTQASVVNFPTVNATDMTINWTRGSGNEVLVLVKQGAAVDSDPVDGTYTGYTANATFTSGTQLGTGNHVVYKGTGTSVTVTGLANTTTYHVAVYEIAGAADTAGDALGSNYLLTPATGSQITATPANQNPNTPSNPSFDQFKSDTTTLIPQGTYTDEGTIVFKATVSDNDGDPVQLQVEIQPVGTAFSNSANCGPGTAVASGTLATVTCSGLGDGEYKWQAQAIDDKAATGGWLEY